MNGSYKSKPGMLIIMGRPVGSPSERQKTPGLIRGRSLLCSIRSDDMCVRTDENPKVFVLCYFCRPGANARGETRKNSKKVATSHFFDRLRAAKRPPFCNVNSF